MSLPLDRMTTNPQSLYASFLGLQAQHAESGYDEAIISALRETLYDQPMESYPFAVARGACPYPCGGH